MMSLLTPPNPTIDFYSKTDFGNYSWDARGPNSTTDFVLEISGRGLGASTKTVNINAYFDPAMDEGNFDWKNLIVELYNEGDMNNPTNRLGVYDGHRLVNGTQSIPQLDVHEGLSYQLVVKPRNYADLDLNNKVNFKDQAILANQWQATGQGEESTWGNYTNINRDPAGNVGMDDLSIFVNEWLWIADHLPEGGPQAKATPILGQKLGQKRKTRRVPATRGSGFSIIDSGNLNP